MQKNEQIRKTHGKIVKVMVFGTFDLLHPGHLHFLRQAKALGDVLVVSIARDENAGKIKGRPPVFAEKDRLEMIKNLKMVDKAVLGGRKDYLAHILREKPDIIALGYDQRAHVNELYRDVAAGKLKTKIVRLKPFRADKYKSSRYKERIRN